VRALVFASIAALVAATPALAEDACHDGVIEGDVIRWTSYVAVGRDPVVVPRELEIERIEGGRIGPDSTLAASPGIARVRVTSRQPIADRRHVVLRVPRAHGPQRITLAAGHERVRFEPELDGPLERHVGYATTSGVTERDRRSLELECGAAPARSLSIFVGAGELPLRGAITTITDRRVPFAWLGGAVLVLGLVVGGAAYRRFGRRAELERADALIEARFAELDEPPHVPDIKPPSSRP
jgi:hypothetical protein